MQHVRPYPSLTRDSGQHIQNCKINGVLQLMKALSEAGELDHQDMDTTILAAGENVSAIEDCRQPCLCL